MHKYAYLGRFRFAHPFAHRYNTSGAKSDIVLMLKSKSSNYDEIKKSFARDDRTIATWAVSIKHLALIGTQL